MLGGATLALIVGMMVSFPTPTPLFSGDAMLNAAREGLSMARSNGTLGTPAAKVDAVIDVLKRRYGPHIVTDEGWVYNNAGGAMGAFKVLHYSLTEYVIIFGTSVGTEGHSGRFLADDYFTMLHGEQWAFTAGSYQKEVYGPGEQHVMRRGDAKQYRMPDGAWALEYAHGNMISMLPFGVADCFFSTLDLQSLWATISVAVRGILRELSMGKI